MTMPVTYSRSGAFIAPPVQCRLQFGFQHLFDEAANALPNRRLQRIEPVLAQEWQRLV